MSERRVQATVPEPYTNLGSLRATAVALKELVEVLAGQRGDGTERAVTFQDVTERGWDNVNPLRINSINIGAAGSYSYTRPVGLKYLQVELWAAGGGGAGVAAGTATQMALGAGGGGGGYCRKLYKASDLAATENFTLGAGGNGGASGGGAGAAGGNSTFKGQTANGGAGANFQAPTTSPGISAVPGAGGTATGGDMNIQGNQGSACVAFAHGSSNRIMTGAGGGSRGTTIPTSVPTFNAFAPAGAQAPNAVGGSGAGNPINATSAAAGQKGGDGMAILTEFY